MLLNEQRRKKLPSPIDRYYERTDAWAEPILPEKLPQSLEEYMALWKNPKLFEYIASFGKFSFKVNDIVVYYLQEIDIKGELFSGENYVGKICRSLKDDGRSMHHEEIFLLDDFRGSGYASQLYTRTEDFMEILSSQLPNPERERIEISISTAKDIGKYVWMNQGFRYTSNTQRRKHITSLVKASDRLLKSFGEKAYYSSPGAEAASLKELGWDRNVVLDFKQWLESKIEDDSVEPWDIISHSPKDREVWRYSKFGSYGIERQQKTLIRTYLAKELALEGDDWRGKKQINTKDKKSLEGINFADAQRALLFERLFSRGIDWDWLGV